MNTAEIIAILGALSPEISLAGFTFLALGVDIFCLRGRTVENRHEFLGRLSLAALAVAFLLYAMQFQFNAPFVIGKGMFVVSGLNLFFKMVVLMLACAMILIGLSTPYSAHVGEYYALILFSVLGMVFLISSEDLLMIFVSLELISLTLYILTAFQKGARRSVEGGLKYFVFGGLSAAFLLFGLSYIYGATGHTSLRSIAATLATANEATVPYGILNIGILFTLVGLGFKIAAAPFHLWAPDAYEGAPTPVAALIATGSKVASFVALTKVLLGGLVVVAGHVLSIPQNWQAGWAPTVAVIAVLSMGLGNVAAIVQTNVKRLLAYSSVAHAGYILVAIVALDAGGIPATLGAPAVYFYILIYALTNVGAFGVVNAIAAKAGGDDFEHFTGMARRAPFLSLLLLIFVLSLAGIPPLAGFFGKFYLFAAAVQADPKNLGLLWLVFFAILMSAVSLYYYLKLLKQVYVVPSADQRPLMPCRVSSATLGLVSLGVVLLGIFPTAIINLIARLDGKPSREPPAIVQTQQGRPTGLTAR